jgi:methionyl-tRNA formyltransferase
MRIIYLGSGEIGGPSLRWLAQHHDVVAVVAQPDKPAGRKLTLTPPPTQPIALEYGLKLWQPARIKDIVPEIVALRADLIVVMAYGQYLPKTVREAGRLGCINLHASLLPRWRGACPIHAALAAGDAQTGVTVMHVAAGMDTGDMILAESTPIHPTETGQHLHDRLAQLAPQALARAVAELEAGTASRTAQDETQATHCAKLTREAGLIDWTRPAAELERLVRAFDPWPGTSTRLPDSRSLKIFPPLSLEPTDLARVVGITPGTVIQVEKSGFWVQTGTEVVKLSGELQPEGKRRMTAMEFLAGRPVHIGERLGAVGK